MAAANTDLLKKGVQTWQGTLAGSITLSSTTITLTSAVGLPVDTAVEITIDRVDSSGVKTPAKKEVVTGVVSANNLIDCVRGEEGTAQSHASGAVVEVRLTAHQWNDMVDFLLTSFNQDGTFKNKNTSATYTPAGAGITTIYPTFAKVNTITMPATTQTIAVSGDVANQYFVVEIINTTSQGALTWFTTIKWADGVTPSLCGVNGKIDSFGFKVVSTGNYLGYVIGQNQ